MKYKVHRAVVIGPGQWGGGSPLANAGVPVHLLDVPPDKLTAGERKASPSRSAGSQPYCQLRVGPGASRDPPTASLPTTQHWFQRATWKTI